MDIDTFHVKWHGIYYIVNGSVAEMASYHYYHDLREVDGQHDLYIDFYDLVVLMMLHD